MLAGNCCIFIIFDLHVKWLYINPTSQFDYGVKCYQLFDT